jgi:four helix bundle protein
MQNFRKLKVWHASYRLALDLYDVTRTFPKEELYGVTSQLRRAAMSIPRNLAEGCGRQSDADFARFVGMSIASAFEVEHELMFARDLAFLERTDFLRLDKQREEIRRMLVSLHERLVTPRAQDALGRLKLEA